MPFVSKSQWRQCFAAAKRGQRKITECKEFASMSKSYKSLPEKISKQRKQRRSRKMIRQRAIQDFADESEGDIGVADAVLSAMDSPYDDFSYEEDRDAEIYPEDYEPTPEYFQMAPKRKRTRKTIKKRGGSKRRFRKMN